MTHLLGSVATLTVSVLPVQGYLYIFCIIFSFIHKCFKVFRVIELLSVRSTVCTLLYSLAGCLFRYFLSSFGPKWNLLCFNEFGEKNVIRNIRIWVNLVRRPKVTEARSIHFTFVFLLLKLFLFHCIFQ